MLIAIDGPAAAGKGVLAKTLANHFSVPHLDTGMLYRIVAMDLIRAGKAVTDADAAVAAAAKLDVARYSDAELRGRHMGEAASIVSAIPELRQALMTFQRSFAAQPGGAVLDGRDIGTVICPEADIKFFVTAEPEVRASRRTAELTRRGDPAVYEEVLADIRKRDLRDSSRSSAPLTRAVDAVFMDTSRLSVEDMISIALEAIQHRQPSAEASSYRVPA